MVFVDQVDLITIDNVNFIGNEDLPVLSDGTQRTINKNWQI